MAIGNSVTHPAFSFECDLIRQRDALATELRECIKTFEHLAANCPDVDKFCDVAAHIADGHAVLREVI